MSTSQVANQSPLSAPGRNSSAGRQVGALDVLVMSAWAGLAGGLLEVGAKVLSRSMEPTHRLYMRSRHFVWLTPLSMLLLFTVMGLLLALGTKLWPRLGAWICPRLILFLAVWPVLIVVGPVIYPAAWAIVALGSSMRFAPIRGRHVDGIRRWQ